jgi:hypothetical protein
MSGYSLGREVEYAVIHNLVDNGYEHMRGASSKGLCDVLAIKEGEVLFINVKRTTPPGPAERADLLRVAGYLPGVGVPLVALGPASRVTYRLLTGVGAKNWVSWTPDEIGDASRLNCPVCGSGEFGDCVCGGAA